jgi:dihydroorotate dehydrogenase (fumarate)
MQMGPKPYLSFIEDARKAVSIPVIASVNCTTAKWWVSYAKDMEAAGASAIELNISHFPQRDAGDTVAIEQRYTDIVNAVAGRVTIPVAVKLGFHFTALWDVLSSLSGAGARGLVLFNRNYGVDIDLKKKRFTPSMSFSSPQEMNLPLRWVGLTAGSLSCDIAASTGIHDVESVAKMLMAGAAAVQVCSALYLNGVGYLAELVEDLDKWLEENCYKSVKDIRGVAIQQTPARDILLHRLQYLKALNEAAKYDF